MYIDNRKVLSKEMLKMYDYLLNKVNKEIYSGEKLGNNVNRLKERKKDILNKIANIERNSNELDKITSKSYYAVLISYSGSNEEHKAIMYVGSHIMAEIYNTTYSKKVISMSMDDIYSIKIIKNISDLYI